MLPSTLQFVIAMIACAINERMQRKLDYTQEEVRIPKELLRTATGTLRFSFTADQRRRLALAGKELTPKDRRKCCQIVKPATILAWFRALGARKYDGSKARTLLGRPRKAQDIRKLVIEMAQANLGWGYTKIRDALRTGLKIEIGRTTVANILAEAGIEPAPEREKKRTWKQFMKMYWESLYACDFLDPSEESNCNPHAERFVKTIKYECLNHFIFFGERHLCHVLKEFVAHYLTERFHQGLDGQLVKGQVESANDNGTNGPISCRSRLGGMLNYYHRVAA